MQEAGLGVKALPVQWTVVILDREYVVTAEDCYKAKRLAAHMYRDEKKALYPIGFLKGLARVRCHEDKRVKFHLSNQTISILEAEQARRALLEAEDEIKEDVREPGKNINPTRW